MDNLRLLGVFLTITLTNSLREKRANHCPLHDLTIENGSYQIKSGVAKVEYKCAKEYVLYGAETLYCVESSWNNKPPTCITNTCQNIPVKEPLRVKKEHNGSLLRFSCAVMNMLEGPEVITCNGRSWSDSPPTCKLSAPATSCTFEDPGLCGWDHHDDTDVKWIFHMGRTKSTDTGPEYDHTFGASGKGRYMYFETSSPTRTGHKAILVSPLYPANYSRRCFNFWYHLLVKPRKSVSQLQVVIKPERSDLDDLSAAFSVKENKGRNWLNQTVLVPRLTEPFHILFVATKGTNAKSDIAVDDVLLYKCPDRFTTSTTTSTVVTNRQTTLVKTPISTKEVPSGSPTVTSRSTTLEPEIRRTTLVKTPVSTKEVPSGSPTLTSRSTTLEPEIRRTTLVKTPVSTKEVPSGSPTVTHRSTTAKPEIRTTPFVNPPMSTKPGVSASPGASSTVITVFSSVTTTVKPTASTKPETNFSSAATHSTSTQSPVSRRSDTSISPTALSTVVTKFATLKATSRSVKPPETTQLSSSVASTSAARPVTNTLPIALQKNVSLTTTDTFSAHITNSAKNTHLPLTNPDIHAQNVKGSAIKAKGSSDLIYILVGTGLVIAACAVVGVGVYCHRRRQIERCRESLEVTNPLYTAVDSDEAMVTIWHQ